MWWVIPGAGFVGFLSYFDLISIAVTGPQGMNEALALTATAFGLVAGLSSLGFALFEVPSSFFLAKFGTRRWLTRVMLTWGALQLLTTFVPNSTWLFIIRILLGIAIAGMMPALFAYVSSWFPRRYRPMAQAMVSAVFMFSGIFGPALGTLIIEAGNAAPFADVLPGWRLVFLVTGALALITGVALWKLMREKPSEAGWFTPEEATFYAAALESDREATHAPIRSVGKALLDWRVILLGVGYFAICYAQYAITIWMPTIVLGFGQQFNTSFTAIQSSLLSGVPLVFALFAALLLGYLASKHGHGGWWVAGGASIGAIGAVATAFAQTPAFLLGAIALIAIGANSTAPIVLSMVPRVVAGKGVLSAFALVNTMGAGVGVLSAPLTGWLTEVTGSNNAAFYVMAGSLLLGAVVMVTVERIARSHELQFGENTRDAQTRPLSRTKADA
jgi:MFS family permease